MLGLRADLMVKPAMRNKSHLPVKANAMVEIHTESYSGSQSNGPYGKKIDGSKRTRVPEGRPYGRKSGQKDKFESCKDGLKVGRTNYIKPNDPSTYQKLIFANAW
jgi:hypothetical protein